MNVKNMKENIDILQVQLFPSYVKRIKIYILHNATKSIWDISCWQWQTALYEMCYLGSKDDYHSD